jgi:aspartyl-tRNA(Asn)/glutamyl-tRNA(Gln) amidotransferase subunit C
MSVVSVTDVQQVAQLARLALSAKELETLAAQLDHILEYVRQLQSVPTQGVAPTSHVLPLADVLRPDQRLPSLPPETIAELAPARHGNLIKVPKVIE